jgi:RNA polymerase sigma-70 factor (ECF subfamily)
MCGGGRFFVEPMGTQVELRQWFERVVRDNYRLLYSVAFPIVRQPAACEDAVQEGCLRAYRNLGKLDDPAAVVPWLVRIVRNVALDEARRRKIATAELVDSPMEPVDRTAAGPESDMRQLLMDEIATLSDGLAEVIALRFFEGLEIEQIGKRLGLTSNAVRVRLHRGLEHLRRLPRIANLSEVSES